MVNNKAGDKRTLQCEKIALYTGYMPDAVAESVHVLVLAWEMKSPK
jgi:hypothetical protein